MILRQCGGGQEKPRNSALQDRVPSFISSLQSPAVLVNMTSSYFRAALSKDETDKSYQDEPWLSKPVSVRMHDFQG